MASTEEIKGMIRDVLESIKTRLDDIDQEIVQKEQEINQLRNEKNELQQLLPSWQAAPRADAAPMGTISSFRS